VHAVLVADDADLAGHNHLVAPSGDRPTKQSLVVASSIAHRRVQKRDPDVDRPSHGRNRLVVVGRTVRLGHSHAAEADR